MGKLGGGGMGVGEFGGMEVGELCFQRKVEAKSGLWRTRPRAGM